MLRIQPLSFILRQDDFHRRVCGCQWASVGCCVFIAGKSHLFWGLIWSGPGPVYQRWQSKYLKTNVSVLVINTRLMTTLLATLPLKTNLLILTI